jgi:hypothetical protein
VRGRFIQVGFGEEAGSTDVVAESREVMEEDEEEVGESKDGGATGILEVFDRDLLPLIASWGDSGGTMESIMANSLLLFATFLRCVMLRGLVSVLFVVRRVSSLCFEIGWEQFRILASDSIHLSTMEEVVWINLFIWSKQGVSLQDRKE